MTPGERQVATIWQEILDVGLVGRRDSFFLLGGDSIMLFTMLNRIEAETGYQIPLTEFFEDLTLCTLAAIVDDLDQARQQLAADGSM